TSSAAQFTLADTFHPEVSQPIDRRGVRPKSNFPRTPSRPTWAPLRHEELAMKSSNAARSTMLACALALLPVCAHSEEGHHEWDSAAQPGPKHWGELKPDFESCALGKEQSPIDIRYAVPSKLEPIRFEYRP